MWLGSLLEYVEAQEMVGEAKDGTLIKDFNPIGKWGLKWLAMKCDGRIEEGYEHDKGCITPDTVPQCE